MAARSFSTTALQGDGFAKTLSEARSHVSTPTGGIIFVTGALARQTAQVGALVRSAWKGVPVVVVPGAGILTERGEVEGAAAASGLLWSGGRTLSFAIPDDATDFNEALSRSLASRAPKDKASTTVLFPRPEAFQPSALDDLASFAPSTCLFGAGAVGGAGVCVTPAGEVLGGRAVGLVVTGMATPIVDASPSCRLLTPLTPIDDASGGMVLSVGGRPALDLLSSLAGVAPSGAQPVVLAAFSDQPPDEDGHERFILRPVRGIDPSRRGVMIGPDARPGVRFAFAVRDGAASRADLEATARRIAKHALGSAPGFAIFLTCAGRGQSLYGAPDVESRILRQRFGDLPIAGMHSAFEIAPCGPGRAQMQLFTGVLALFRSPS